MAKTIAIDINDVFRDNLSHFAEVYTDNIDDNFEFDRDKVKTNDLSKEFPFRSKEEYLQFNYSDYAYELYARTPQKVSSTVVRSWMQSDMRFFETNKIPHLMLVSPMESGLTIQATMSFLSAFASTFREIYFPEDSSTIWDRCDILITANPKLLTNVPEGKVAIKINMPYNSEIKCEHSYDSFEELIKTNVIQGLIKNDK